MGWFGIQLNAGSYFCMRDKVFWWRVIAAASGGCLGVLWAVQYTVCLLKQNTGDWILDLLHHFSPLSSLCQKGSVAGRAQINLFCWKWARYSKTHTNTQYARVQWAVWKIRRIAPRRNYSRECCCRQNGWVAMNGNDAGIAWLATHKLTDIMHLKWRLQVL